MAPEEIRTLLEALNGLFSRVEKTLESERRFTADAAHELRTPLAALQAQLQVARRARNDAERDHSLLAMQTGLTRAAHLVEQMLQLARLDPESGLPEPITVDLVPLVESVCADLGPALLAKHLDFDLVAPPQALIIGQPEWLRILARNLIDNAQRYTPEGGQLRVEISKQASRWTLAVHDSGPGIPPAERATVLRRFHRLHHDKASGSGLGLAIVTRIAELHDARLELDDSPLGGLAISVTWRELYD